MLTFPRRTASPDRDGGLCPPFHISQYLLASSLVSRTRPWRRTMFSLHVSVCLVLVDVFWSPEPCLRGTCLLPGVAQRSSANLRRGAPWRTAELCGPRLVSQRDALSSQPAGRAVSADSQCSLANRQEHGQKKTGIFPVERMDS